MQKNSASRDGFFSWRILSGVSLVVMGGGLAFVALNANIASSVHAQPAHSPLRVVQAVHADISAPVRNYPAWPLHQNEREHEAAENPHISTGLHRDAPDPVVQSQMLQRLSSIPSPLLNFPGIPYPGVGCNCAPPDTNGEVGATQYVQIVNEGYQVWNKTTGTSVFGPASIESIWTGFGGVCENSGAGDPVVLYDQLANRWVISQFALDNSGNATDECIAVSTSSDATGSYARYDFHLGPDFFDYPKLSVWPDAYYMSDIIFDEINSAYKGPQGFAFDRAKMLAGDPTATVILGPLLGPSMPPMLPADLDGSTLPPAGAPNSFVLFPDTGTYRIYHFHVDFATPANSTFTLFGTSPSAPFTELCSTTRNCIPQLGTSTKLDGIGDRLMFRLAYRNFGDHESVVGNFSVNGGHAGAIRWFELRGVTAGPITTFQESTYRPDTTSRWMGSIAMDGRGNIALGFSASDKTIFPQIRYTGRLATDPLNMMTLGEAHLWDGTGSQRDTNNRWGDYSAMTVDPVDDQTFWYTQEYYDSTSSFNWRTRIGSFKLATGANLVSAASRLTHGAAGSFDLSMPLSGTSGVEDRDGGGNYLAVFTFDTTVTSGTATVTSGTGTAGTPVFSGNEMQVPLSGVADQQVITIEVSNVNGGGGSNDVQFGFLAGDVDASRVVDRDDLTPIQNDKGATADSGNFREDINLSGVIDRPDLQAVKTNRNHSIP
jgi:hypothetical protein